MSSNSTPNKVAVGGEAFQTLLDSIDVPTEIKKLTEAIPNTKSVSKRDAMVKRLKYLVGLGKQGKLSSAVMLNYVPVAPPKIRPAIVGGGNKIEFSDVNQLYRDHMLVNEGLKDLKDVLPDEDLKSYRKANYDGLKAVVGLGEAISPTSQSKGLKGYVKQIAGEGGPKSGFFHSKLLSKKQDFSGRATITSEPYLGFNQVAFPRDMLWTMYKLHILRDLSRNGYDIVHANEAWKTRSPAAVASFNKSIENIPVIMNRAPTLMKSNVTAAYPVPVDHHTVGMNILHLPFFAADSDGDALSFHVPMTPEAVQEAKDKLLPESQVFDPRVHGSKSMVAPGHEAIIGSYKLTEPDMTQAVKNFKTEKEALDALQSGDVDFDTPITIGSTNHDTT